MTTLRVAVSSGLLLAMFAPAVAVAQVDESDMAREVVFRRVASGFCERQSCYLAVEGKPPSDALMKRLRDLPNTRPFTAAQHGRRRPDDRAMVIDLRSTELLPDGTARVDELTTMGNREISACRHVLSRGQDGWQVDRKKSMCDLT